ncbi:speriolin isoform X2 [Cygnus olor]|uniref:speriolin isoform X2 n=1 Tax=Cygnus olor TaxID=8869 RepID=UPI001ADE8709|nr:speriolin isoform X2 [Cygnus olor]
MELGGVTCRGGSSVTSPSEPHVPRDGDALAAAGTLVPCLTTTEGLPMPGGSSPPAPAPSGGPGQGAMQPLPAIRPSRAGLSVFACYDQLRHEIQALLAENEELARVVNLIKEHQQLQHILRGHPSIQPLLVSTPRDSPGDPAGGTAASAAWDRESAQNQSVPLSPTWFNLQPQSITSETSLPGTEIGTVLFSPVTGNKTVPVNMYGNPSVGGNYLRLSCPPELYGNFSLPLERQLPPEQPPDPRKPEQRSPSVQQPDLQSPGPPVTPVTVTPIAVTSIPVTPAPVPPEPLSPEQQQKPLDLRLPDVRRKEPSRKSPRAAERPPATPQTPHGASQRDARHWERLVGEIAFQLDRRILANIFPERPRLYGFTSIFSSSPGVFDEQYCAAMARRYITLMTRLRALGYNPEVHPALAESLVNTFGILRELPEAAGSNACATPSPSHLRRVVAETVPPAVRADALVLLECLQELAREDGKPLFLS